ncbi:MAG: ABC transporter permease [Clostridiales bacterium]|nr:ABC transporter permease [Clostridiales bacterium]
MLFFWQYLKVRLWQALRAFPVIFGMTLALAAVFALLIFLQLRLGESDASLERARLGIVDDEEDRIVAMGISLIESYDSSRFSVEFLQEDDEDAAKADLMSGKLSAYVVVPDGFLMSIYTGENLKVTVVTDSEKTGVAAMLLREFADALSSIITETQAGSMSVEEIYGENGLEGEELYQASLAADAAYFSEVLSREDFFDVETVDGARELTAGQFAACSAAVLFALLWGMNSAPLLIKKDYSLARLLASRGLSSWAQPVAEFAAHFILLFSSAAGIVAIFYAICVAAGTSVYGILGITPMFWLMDWPVLLCSAALIYFLYALTDSLVAGLLCNFAGAIVLGYLSGCFYPIGYFPKVVRALAKVLPTGIGMEYMGDVIFSGDIGYRAAFLVIYAALFVALAAFVRRKKVGV